ncbi:Aminotransferase class I and II [Alloalcanivorax dieselolei B5]|uniref:Aminotransferase n=1 Tax=Alcanivorax dieselolei (strain DSM 16502 / CGMCC 1.3690 / MCCC 1A00001 / B-5) TaxID=930169 RepID=K0C5I8_ALCDB|nr:aminotransferase class I/II-fold pyridoxal phosphate-dependent enzyme [Alloalcanivorax dieselolei]AFT68694.1 Aminotransferase class I and II [Alloalcanivorax dieselolei B5]GGK05229.1 aminotransferase [Alloalcanivorax dieselolei]
MRAQPGVNLNLNVRGLGVSATLAINELSNDLLRQGREVFKLGLGQSPFPVPEWVVDALRQHAAEKDYLPVLGLPELRRAVAGYWQRWQGSEFSADDVMIGPGSKELMFILQLVFYGDLVIPTPSWVSYAPQARIVGRPVHWLPTRREDHWKPRAEALDALCRQDPDRPRLVILNSPANPHGYAFTETELRALADVARRYRLILLSDEIYGQLQFNGGHQSISRYYPEGTIVSGGLSKWCGAGGWRLGVFAFPETLQWLRRAMATVASETYTSVSAPIQYAAVTAFQGGMAMDGYLHQSRRILAALAEHHVDLLRGAGVPMASTDGAFYLFPDLSPLTDTLRRRGIEGSVELCASLLEDTGVATLPGEAFGRPPSEPSLRLAFVDFDGGQALEAAAGLEGPLEDAFLRRYCGRCVTAMEKLANWIAA